MFINSGPELPDLRPVNWVSLVNFSETVYLA